MDMISPSASAASALLMLPGLMCDQRVFTPQAAAFAGATGPNGYGRLDSLCKMAEHVLQSAPDRFSLLGHSMGARVALEIVRAAPERVERLALLSTGVHPVRPGEAEKRMALRDLGRSQGMEALVDAWLPPMVGILRRTDSTFMKPVRQMCIDAGIETYEAQIAALLSRPDTDEVLASIKCPTMVAFGVEDTWSPGSQHADIAAKVPGARLIEIAGSGHMLPLEQPGALNTAIANWLNQPLGNR